MTATTTLPKGVHRHGNGLRYRWTEPLTKARQGFTVDDALTAKRLIKWVGAQRKQVLDTDPRLVSGRWLFESIGDTDYGPDVTLGEYGDVWKADRDVAARTMVGYEQALNRARPYHHLPLTDFTPEQLGRVRNDLRKRFEPLTVRNTLRIIRSIIKHAARNEIIPTDPSPNYKYSGGATRKREHRYLSPDEYLAIRRHARDEQTRLMMDLMFKLGMRLGEVLGLRHSQVRLDGNVPYVLINHTRWQGGGYGLPKYDKVRQVPVPPRLAADLRNYLDRVDPHHFVFPSRYQPRQSISHHGFTKTAWRTAVAGAVASGELSLREGQPTPHDLRHSYASLMIEKHALPLVAERLGHGSTQVTADVYAHVIQRKFDPSINTVEDALGQSTDDARVSVLTDSAVQVEFGRLAAADGVRSVVFSDAA